jgi:SAM-dependent methyltransferase
MVEEYDRIGEETLLTVGEANRFNKWMYDTIHPYCNGKILEIGSGLGNISKYFLENSARIFLSDLNEDYCNKLKIEFESFPNLLGVDQIDLVLPDFDEVYQKYFNSYDTIFALNVVEHIQDDKQAILNCHKLLKSGGNLVILVPAYQSLYNGFDKGLGHFRRYNKRKLRSLFDQTDYRVIHEQYFNAIGILGWFFSGNILKKETIPSGQMTLYNTLVPVFKVIDSMIFRKVGLSSIIVAQKGIDDSN